MSDNPMALSEENSQGRVSKTNANGPRRPRLYTWRRMRSDVHPSIVDSLDDAVVVIDDAHFVVACNAPMERLTRSERAGALGRPIEDVLAALPPALWNRPIVLALAGGRVSVAVIEARPVATPDILADPRWQLDTVRRRHIAREGFKAVAAAPLLVKGVVRGSLAVHSWMERTFTDDEMAVLTLLAERGALALENARLYADARRSGGRLRELAQLEQMVAASLDPDAVLRAIAAAAVRLVGADIVQVWTAD